MPSAPDWDSDPRRPGQPDRPGFLIIRYRRSVYFLPAEVLGEPLDYDDNTAIYERTYESPFLDGLAFAGAYASGGDIQGPASSTSTDDLPPPSASTSIDELDE